MDKRKTAKGVGMAAAFVVVAAAILSWQGYVHLADLVITLAPPLGIQIPEAASFIPDIGSFRQMDFLTRGVRDFIAAFSLTAIIGYTAIHAWDDLKERITT